MVKLIIKYAIVVVSTIIVSRLLTSTILEIWPNLSSIPHPDGGNSNIGAVLLEIGIGYLLNIVILFLMMKDMKKENLKSKPVLILTFLFTEAGIAFFLLAVGFKKLVLAN